MFKSLYFPSNFFERAITASETAFSHQRSRIVVTAFTLVLNQPRHHIGVSKTITQVKLVVGENSLGERERALPPPRFLDVRAPFESLLASDLVLVELSEVVDNDGNGEGDDENAADAANKADTLAQEGLRHHVAVAYRGHRDGGPPEGSGDAGEQRLRLLPLSEVGEAGEDKNTHGEEHKKQAEFLVGILDCEAKALEPGGVARQLENAQHSHHSEDLYHSFDVLVLLPAHVGLYQEEGDEVWEDGKHVNDIEAAFEELPLVAGGYEAQDVLESEPGDADGLHHGERFVLLPGQNLPVLVHRGERGQRVQTKRNRGNQNERNT